MVNKKRILIIGGTGFIGYHLAKFAIKQNFSVYSISKKSPKRKRQIKNVKYIYMDLSRFEKLRKINLNFEFVINASGYGSHYNFDNKGLNLYYNNFNSLVNLVNFFKKKKIKKFIQLGSSFEYGESKKEIRENYLTNPSSIYGLSKLACTNYLKQSYNENSFPITIFRLFQVYGPLQDDNRLIPFVINSCKKNKNFKVTSGKQIRNFCYIDDVVRAIFLSLNNKKTNGEIFNLGSKENLKVKSVIKTINYKVGRGKPIFGKERTHIGEKNKIIPNINKIKKILNWEPKYSIERGLNKIL